MNKIKDSDYHLEYQEQPIQQDLKALSDGLAEEDILRKGMEPRAFPLKRFGRQQFI